MKSESMTVVPTASGEPNLTTTTGTNVSGETSTAGSGTAAAVSGAQVTPSAGEGVHGLPLLRRNRPGTKAAAFSTWPEEDWSEMDSTLAVQQVKRNGYTKVQFSCYIGVLVNSVVFITITLVSTILTLPHSSYAF